MFNGLFKYTKESSVNLLVCILISDFSDDKYSSGVAHVSRDIFLLGNCPTLTGDGRQLVIRTEIEKTFSASCPLVAVVFIQLGRLDIIKRLENR